MERGKGKKKSKKRIDEEEDDLTAYLLSPESDNPIP